ncbi:unnamed protein product [Brassica napus]|uniref:(rape) hypothetical protein n=1 Tax=Brassica napus TaxID=3708 RepID=A0A816LE86_BRANA|nr:unnamed protein product [Brassica napus]
MFRERSGLEMDIRRSLNLLRGDFGTRRIGTIDCFKGIYTTRSKPLRAYLQDAICRGLSYGSLSVIQLIMVRVKVFLEYMDFVFVYMTFIWGQNKGSKRGILVEQKGHGATNEMTTKIKLDGLLHLFKTLGICQKVRSISGLLIMEGGLIQSIYLWHPTDGFLTHMRFPHTSTSLL